MSQPSMPDAYRAFVALTLPQPLRHHLGMVQRCLSGQGLLARWVRPESIHLTLKFLGRLEPEKVETVAAALETIAGQHRPLQLTVQDLGGFPRLERARVLWMGIGGDSDRLARLQEDIDTMLAPLGWRPEKRLFKGHLTLARAKGRRPFDQRALARSLSQCVPKESVAFTADRLTLYHSRLRPEGAVYDKLHQWDL